MMRRLLQWALVLVLGTGVAHAEPVYVIEQLVVSVTSAPGGEGDRVATIKSGDRLELLERQSDEAHVRLPSGAEGWIKASYLSSDQPLQRRLTERTAELEKLKLDVNRLEAELAAARAGSAAHPAAAAPPADPSPTTVSAGGPDTAQASPGIRDVSGFLTTPELPSPPLWEWVLGTAAVMLLLGFTLGWRMLDRRIRRKFGGLRIY
jgi:hypothetical protein